MWMNVKPVPHTVGLRPESAGHCRLPPSRGALALEPCPFTGGGALPFICLSPWRPIGPLVPWPLGSVQYCHLILSFLLHNCFPHLRVWLFSLSLVPLFPFFHCPPPLVKSSLTLHCSRSPSSFHTAHPLFHGSSSLDPPLPFPLLQIVGLRWVALLLGIMCLEAAGRTIVWRVDRGMQQRWAAGGQGIGLGGHAFGTENRGVVAKIRKDLRIYPSWRSGVFSL